MFYFEIALGQPPANHQEDAEQKLLSTPLLLVAIETQAMMESRRVWGRVERLHWGEKGRNRRIRSLPTRILEHTSKKKKNRDSVSTSLQEVMFQLHTV